MSTSSPTPTRGTGTALTVHHRLAQIRQENLITLEEAAVRATAQAAQAGS
ncbi:hypothetical protein [Nonomuraea rubra]|uniref:Putative membrane protein n=1 Tax=Nonomuraea rubra TaxID=46180 RepID=A0A7X0NP04_9ACTN|nr:hypothetical protein [Nonomuraea rubra]MBB6547000.1 putative membrane protein [Nonomuraea rubra]